MFAVASALRCGNKHSNSEPDQAPQQMLVNAHQPHQSRLHKSCLDRLFDPTHLLRFLSLHPQVDVDGGDQSSHRTCLLPMPTDLQKCLSSFFLLRDHHDTASCSVTIPSSSSSFFLGSTSALLNESCLEIQRAAAAASPSDEEGSLGPLRQQDSRCGSTVPFADGALTCCFLWSSASTATNDGDRRQSEIGVCLVPLALVIDTAGGPSSSAKTKSSCVRVALVPFVRHFIPLSIVLPSWAASKGFSILPTIENGVEKGQAHTAAESAYAKRCELVMVPLAIDEDDGGLNNSEWFDAAAEGSCAAHCKVRWATIEQDLRGVALFPQFPSLVVTHACNVFPAHIAASMYASRGQYSRSKDDDHESGSLSLTNTAEQQHLRTLWRCVETSGDESAYVSQWWFHHDHDTIPDDGHRHRGSTQDHKNVVQTDQSGRHRGVFRTPKCWYIVRYPEGIPPLFWSSSSYSAGGKEQEHYVPGWDATEDDKQRYKQQLRMWHEGRVACLLPDFLVVRDVVDTVGLHRIRPDVRESLLQRCDAVKDALLSQSKQKEGSVSASSPRGRTSGWVAESTLARERVESALGAEPNVFCGAASYSSGAPTAPDRISLRPASCSSRGIPPPRSAAVVPWRPQFPSVVAQMPPRPLPSVAAANPRIHPTNGSDSPLKMALSTTALGNCSSSALSTDLSLGKSEDGPASIVHSIEGPSSDVGRGGPPLAVEQQPPSSSPRSPSSRTAPRAARKAKATKTTTTGSFSSAHPTTHHLLLGTMSVDDERNGAGGGTTTTTSVDVAIANVKETTMETSVRMGGVAAGHEEGGAVRLLPDPKKPRAPRKPKPPPVAVALPTAAGEDCSAAAHHPLDAGAVLLPLEGTAGNNERGEETVATTAPSCLNLEKSVDAAPEEDEEDEDKPLIARLAKIVVRNNNNNNKRPRSTTTKKKSDVECGVDTEGVALVKPDKKPPRRPRVETKSADAQSNSPESLATAVIEDAAAL